MKRTQLIWLIVFGSIVFFLSVLFYFDFLRFLRLEHLQKHSASLLQAVQNYYALSVLIFISGFTLIIAFSLPVAGPLTLLGGFLFGVVQGVLFSLIGATIGATTAFLFLRRGVDEMVREKYGKRLEKFERRIEEYGPPYLLMLHFSTLFPYAVINVLAALANISVVTIVWTTAVGFLPSALVYAFAGSRLTTITSIRDVFSPQIILALVLLVLLMLVPIIVKQLKNREAV